MPKNDKAAPRGGFSCVVIGCVERGFMSRRYTPVGADVLDSPSRPKAVPSQNKPSPRG